MMDWYQNGMSGGGWLAMSLLMVAFWGLVVLAVLMIFRGTSGGSPEAGSGPVRDPMRTLDERYARLLYSIALRITNDRAAAEEVLQDVFHSVWLRATTFSGSTCATQPSRSAWTMPSLPCQREPAYKPCFPRMKRRSVRLEMVSVMSVLIIPPRKTGRQVVHAR